MGRKSLDKTGKRCKAPRYSRPWLGPLLDDARATDLPSACDRAKVSLSDLARLRATDPALDAALVDLHLTARLAAAEAITSLAAGGDLRAVRALCDGTLAKLAAPEELADGPPQMRPDGSWRTLTWPQIRALLDELDRRQIENAATVGPVVVECPGCHLALRIELIPSGLGHYPIANRYEWPRAAPGDGPLAAPAVAAADPPPAAGGGSDSRPASVPEDGRARCPPTHIHR